MLATPVRVYSHDFNDPDITPWTSLPLPEVGEIVFVMDYSYEFGTLATVVEPSLGVGSPAYGEDMFRACRVGPFIYAEEEE